MDNISIRLIDADRQAYAIGIIADLPTDGSREVTIHGYKADRSQKQNSLCHLWYREIGKWLHFTHDEVENYCKYRFGLSILSECEEFNKDLWRDMLQPLTHEQRVEPMHNIEVTRLFNVEQFSRYLDEVERHYQQQGVRLTQPEDLIAEALGR